jgi:hypothetical protein
VSNGAALVSAFNELSPLLYRPLKDAIIVVSGLPRSGTSMMMRMLQAGGLEVVTDNRRIADESNPLGYSEDERVKRLREGHPEWLDSAIGKAVKIVSPLLEYLPARHVYKLIFMLRSVEEIVASQRRMLSRQGETAAKETDEELAVVYRNHLRRIEAWLVDQPHFESMYVHYRDIIEDAEGHARRISHFSRRSLDRHAMVAAVDGNLYRERFDHPGWVRDE